MAIAVKLDEKDTAKKTGVLEISADKYYNDTLRPFMEGVLINCKTDPEITRSVDKIINACDGFMKDGSKDALVNAVDVVEPTIKVLSADSYYRDGALRRANDDEVKKVKELLQKLNDYTMLLNIEIPDATPKEEPQGKERIAYTPSGDGKGENTDWKIRNVKTLNEPHPKKRLPNA